MEQTMRPTLDIESVLADLPGWSRAEGDRPAIARSFRFSDFNSAWGWMNQAALLAEKLDHHPEWSNVYGRVDVLLTTHDAGGVTELDVTMARFMDQAAARLS
jgi:4a-hydroxytetrahydrobiopterin dehydratase